MCECTAAITQPQPSAPASLIYFVVTECDSVPHDRSQELRKRKRAHAHAETLKTRTLRLAELMEDDDVMRVVEVFGQSLDVPPAQSVGHKESSSVSVRPVDTILEHRPKENSRVYFNKDKLAAVFQQPGWLRLYILPHS